MQLSLETKCYVIVIAALLPGCVAQQTASSAHVAMSPSMAGTGRYAERTPPPRPLNHLPAPPLHPRTISDPAVRDLLQRVESNNLLKFEHNGELFRIYRENCRSFPCTPFGMTLEQQEHMKFVIAAADYEEDANRMILAELSAKAINLASRMDSAVLAEILYKIDLLRKRLEGTSQISHDAGLMLYGPPGR